MSNRTCLLIRHINLLLFTGLASLIVFSKADGQSVMLDNTAFARTLDALSVGAACPEAGGPEACGRGAAAEVIEFLKAPHPGTAPTRARISEACDSVAPTESCGRWFLTLREQAGFVNDADGSESAGLSFPSAAFAVADFLIARAKAKLVLSTFREITNAFASGQLRMLFPNARTVLAGSEPRSYRALMPTFKAAVEEDFRSLPRNISIYLDSTTAKTPDPIRVLSLVGDALMRLESGVDILAILSDLYGLDKNWTEKDLQRGLQLFSGFAKEYRAVHTLPLPEGCTSSSVECLLTDTDTAEFFIAFLLSDMEITPLGGLNAYVNGHGAQIRALAAELAGLVDFMKSRDSESSEQGTLDRPSVTRKIASVFQATVPLFASDSIAQNLQHEIERAHSLWTAIEGREYHRMIVLVVNRLPALGDDSAFPRRLLSFAGSVASADDADELREALEALADPVGSFRSRRGPKASRGFSLVSYLGFGVGHEWTTGFGGGDGFYGAIFAPIGIEWSSGARWGSFGIMGSFVDLGALVSYRLTGKKGMTEGGEEDRVDDLPNMTLQHVFSPALSVVFGMTENHPLSVGLTGQFAPELRALEEREEELSVVRLSLFVAIDLTLLRF